MNTPAHLIIGAAAFGRPGDARVTMAAVAGALAPDMSLYVMTAWSLLITGATPRMVFDIYYFSDSWQMVFAVDNSFVLWGAAMCVALVLRRDWLVALCGAALLHLAFDFPLHNDDARRHFWPLTDWVFHSPVSYWDRNHHAGIIGPLETALALSGCVYLWIRFKTLLARVVISLAALTQILPGVMWAWMFATHT